MFDKWLKNKPKNLKDIVYPSDDPIVIDFLIEVQENYYKEMISHLRILEKIPITGTNWAKMHNRKTQLIDLTMVIPIAWVEVARKS